MTQQYETPLSSRYASQYMLELFSADTRYRTWRKLWVALAKAEIPPEAVKHHRKRNPADLKHSRGKLLNVLHLRGIAGFGIGLLVRVADGNNIVQLIVGRNVKTIKEELAFLV